MYFISLERVYMKELSMILIGCGERGSCYMNAVKSMPEKYSLKAIAEPNKERREYFRDTFNVPADMCFESYEQLLALPKLADVAMICTQDKMHFEPAMMAIEKKYDLLLEKPISINPKECFKVAEAAKKNGVRVLVCHVLRYSPFYKFIKRFIKSGRLGEIMNVNHTEGVGNVHMSHSYVRGNWRREDESSPMILAKCSHDADLMLWLLEEQCEKVQSFGFRSYFTSENAPEGAPARCLDGCPYKDTCFYYAPALYKLDTAEVKHFRTVVAGNFTPTDEEIDEKLKTSPYGRCVYHCDNDVVDHQTVNMLFSNGKIATLTMSAFNKGGRFTVFMGTKGELRANMETQSVVFYDFATRETTELYTSESNFDQTIGGGHGGGDAGIMEDLYEMIVNDNPSDSISDISVSCMSHLICFAAEESRILNTVVNMNWYLEAMAL
ncbi:MAG: Gfo/Idh/MocA family oxidoreductase [Clostridia bacterium]|nr:Gfo/Idh/MocA family oxidoreductase [Clostridia bacterium]